MSTAAGTSHEIRGVLLPVASRPLLLPNAAVAEVIAFQEPEADGRVEPGWMGMLDWRGQRLPVVSFAGLLGESQTRGGGRERIVVLNALGGTPLDYMGLHVLAPPRLARITRDSLEPDPEGMPDSDLVAAALVFDGQPAWIPDLDRIEARVAALVETA